MRRLLRRAPGVAALLAGTVLLSAVLTGCDFKGAYDLPLPGKQVSEDDGYQVTALFDDVVNVVPRTVVMANDVPVGQVDAVQRVGWNAKVTMTIRDDIVLPENATADVRQTSLLGEKYIQLAAPVGKKARGRLSDGDAIPLDATARNPEVEEVLGALSFLLSGGGVGQLKTISAELNKMMDGREGDIRSLLGRLDTLVTSLDGQKDEIVNAMSSVDRLTATLNRERRTIGAALDSFGPALKVLDQQHKALMKMLRALDELGEVGTRVIRRSREDVIATLRHLEPTLRKLADAGDSLPRGAVMMASFPFPKEAADLAKGDYSNALFAMDFDLDKIVRAAVQGGDTGLPNLDDLCAVYAGEQNCAPLMNALCGLVKVNLFCDPPLPGPTGNRAGDRKGATAQHPPTEKTKRGDLGDLDGAVRDLLNVPLDLGLGSSTPPSAGATDRSGNLLGLLGGLLGGGSR